MCTLLLHCSSDDGTSTAALRQVSQATPRDGLELEFLYGAVLGSGPTTVDTQATTPSGRITLRAEALSDTSPLTIVLRNVPRAVNLSISAVDQLTSSEVVGCPETTDGADIVDCANETDAARLSTFCALSTEVAQTTAAATVTASVALSSCRIIELRWDPAPSEEPLKVIAIGATGDLGDITRIVNDTRADNPDFYVLLGDNTGGFESSDVDALFNHLAALEIAAIVQIGEQELADDNGQRFRQLFGPYTHAFTYKGVHIVSFYSAAGGLADRGATSLNNFLRTFGSGPRLALSHTPPFDDDDLKEQGFVSRLQAAQVMSLLTSAQVSHIIAGHGRRSSTSTQGTVSQEIVSSNDSIFGISAEYLVLTATSSGQVSTERRAAP